MCFFSLSDYNLQVSALRELIAQETSLPLERLKLVLKGKTLVDRHKDEADSVKLVEGGMLSKHVFMSPSKGGVWTSLFVTIFLWWVMIRQILSLLWLRPKLLQSMSKIGMVLTMTRN